MMAVNILSLAELLVDSCSDGEGTAGKSANLRVSGGFRAGVGVGAGETASTAGNSSGGRGTLREKGEQ
jgi:hypothetical protein